mmetsp:Transcript_89797/g.169174  ORF Transcript_89797/g.169174 Transcript_89797/m.169174 type:complete len:86 (-) Transcript_89797:1425-1682(-)
MFKIDSMPTTTDLELVHSAPPKRVRVKCRGGIQDGASTAVHGHCQLPAGGVLRDSLVVCPPWHNPWGCLGTGFAQAPTRIGTSHM